jgi:predicted RNA-binding Zn-ribbon protein involved in translation (DUF1610 family)
VHHCPKCNSERIHRSRSRTWWESWRKIVSRKRMFRCNDCGWRGWGIDSGQRFTAAERDRAARALAAGPVNLKGTGLEPIDAATPLDLDALDANTHAAIAGPAEEK